MSVDLCVNRCLFASFVCLPAHSLFLPSIAHLHLFSQLSNPNPGTVADTEVTRPERYDFYLVSQSVRQGTVTPVSFNVVWDNSGLKPDHIQRLSYKVRDIRDLSELGIAFYGIAMDSSTDRRVNERLVAWMENLCPFPLSPTAHSSLFQLAWHHSRPR